MQARSATLDLVFVRFTLLTMQTFVNDNRNLHPSTAVRG